MYEYKNDPVFETAIKENNETILKYYKQLETYFQQYFEITGQNFATKNDILKQKQTFEMTLKMIENKPNNNDVIVENDGGLFL